MNNNTNRLRLIWHGIPLVLTAGICAAATPAAAALDSNACQAIITKALQTIQDKCSNISRNSVCYGNDLITAQFANTVAAPQFSNLGDVVAIKQITSLATSALNQQDNTWGMALLKVQANLPDTMPGQNVTFLVYGNTSIQNSSGDMRVFYFSSGLGSPSCTEVPAEGIVVQSPSHLQVTFNANGVQIQIASTIFLHAVANKTLDVTLLEGHATVSAKAGSQSLQPGQMVSVPLGGPTGLEANGPPGDVANLDPNIAPSMVSLFRAFQQDTIVSTQYAPSLAPASSSSSSPQVAPGPTNNNFIAPLAPATNPDDENGKSKHGQGNDDGNGKGNDKGGGH